MRRMRAVVLATAFVALLAFPAGPALAADFSIMGSAYDTDDLSETFGAGFRVGFPFGGNGQFDISGYYFEDFDNKFEDVNTIGVEIGTIIFDFGGTYFFGEERTGFYLGGGVTYAFMDVSNLEVSGETIFEGEIFDLRGEADDEFGFYAKLGWQAQGGFFVEAMYRDLDVSIEDVELATDDVEVSIPSDIDLDLAGYQVNFGWRF